MFYKYYIKNFFKSQSMEASELKSLLLTSFFWCAHCLNHLFYCFFTILFSHRLQRPTTFSISIRLSTKVAFCHSCTPPFFNMEVEKRIELLTCGLQSRCSTYWAIRPYVVSVNRFELLFYGYEPYVLTIRLYWHNNKMEQVADFETASTAWKAAILTFILYLHIMRF